jgi:hypothetical protein
MAKNLNEIMQNLPRDSEALLRSADRRNKIEARAAELIAEYMTLQDSISKLEKRTDLLLSTLRGYLNAMGGELELVVKFSDRPPVVITGLAELDDKDEQTPGI